jgi:uncharacterized protein with GYD domain
MPESKGTEMNHMVLINFTDLGLKNIKDSLKRAGKFRKSVESAGGKILAQYWCLGEYDGCVIFESPTEQITASLILSLAQQGNVKTTTLHAFDEQEFKEIMESLG